jgi:predicted dehydrogenase
MVKSNDIDAIYIPLPTGIRTEWVVKAAEAGKHVLVEKPVGVTAAEVKEIIAVCQRKNVQFMDGVMFMHSKRLDAMRAVLDDGKSVGQIRRIQSHFSFNASDEFLQSNIRVHGQLEPLGCLGDLGWYNTRITLWAMNWQMPKRVTGRMLAEVKHPDNPDSVPLEFSGEMFFENGVSASFYCSFQTDNHQSAQISGTKGYLSLNDYVVPFYGTESSFYVTNNFLRVRGCDYNMEGHTRQMGVAEYGNGEQTAQETNLFRNFATLAMFGKPDLFWGDVALKTQLVIDGCLKSARDGGKPVEL